MTQMTLSDKYQVVIPKQIRKELNLSAGQKLSVSKGKNNTIIIDTTSKIDSLYGSMKGAWGADSDAYLCELRSEADRDRT